MYFIVATALVLAIGMSTQILLNMMRPAHALPAGFFFLELASGPVGVMDVENTGLMVTGLIQFNPPTMRDSQLWKERFPASGSIGFIKLQNKLTGQCLADSSGSSAVATIRPCSDETTVWQKIPLGSNRVAFRRTERVVPPWSDIHVCPGRTVGSATVNTLTCYDFTNVVTWRATLTPLGSTLGGLSSNTTPPEAPTGCTVFGTEGRCGLIGFDCDPLGGDDIVVQAGNIGVAVTGVAPQIGQITGTYLNEGTVSVKVCAVKAGLSSCGNPIPNVRFGPRVCEHERTPPPACPEGTFPCAAGECVPTALCDHLQ
jgi:hypothetical protein